MKNEYTLTVVISKDALLKAWHDLSPQACRLFLYLLDDTTNGGLILDNVSNTAVRLGISRKTCSDAWKEISRSVLIHPHTQNWKMDMSRFADETCYVPFQQDLIPDPKSYKIEVQERIQKQATDRKECK